MAWVELDKDNKPSEKKKELTPIHTLAFADFEKLKALEQRPIADPEPAEEEADSSAPEAAS